MAMFHLRPRNHAGSRSRGPLRLMKALTMAMLALNLLAATGLPAGGQSGQVSEYAAKAAFLYNFAKYVEWPAHAFPADDSPVIFGVLGENPFGTTLQQIIGDKRIGMRPLVVRHFETAVEARECHVLFIKTDRRRTDEAVKAIGTAPVLTVGEAKGFLGAGGVINFFLEGNFIRFEISNDNAKRGGLKLSSKLLSLGKAPDPGGSQ
jgi:hypothetical protein